MRQVHSHLSWRPRSGMSAGFLVVVLVTLSLAPVASAGTISVTTTVDQLDSSPPCSLREAVNTANQDVDGGGCTDANPAAADTIKLASGDYNLQRAGIDDGNVVGDLDVTGSLTIAGAGAAESGIDANGTDRVLQAIAGPLTISGLTVHGGSSTNGAPGGGIAAPGGAPLLLINSTVSGNNADGPGGGIYTPGPATLTNSTVNFNDSDFIGGGGIYAGTATLTNSTVSGNSYNSGPGGPGGPGGGIYAAGTATLTNSTVSGNDVVGAGSAGGGVYASTARLTRSTVSGNHAGASGGGVFAPTARLTNSTVSGNDSSTGGGIYGTSTLTGSTVSGNKASGRGGGIYGAGSLTDSTITGNETGLEGGGIDTESGSLTVTHSTVADNHSINNGGGIFFTSPGTLNVIDSTLSGNQSNAWGGALSTDEGTTNLQSATINRNVADADLAGFAGSGGGLDRFGTAAVRIRNTILAGNIDRSAFPKNPDWNCNGGVVSQGYNLLSSTAGCTVAPASGDQTAAPALAALADNGGKTLTQALLSTSPAINTGNPATPGSGGNACPSTDQRGVPRSLGGDRKSVV